MEISELENYDDESLIRFVQNGNRLAFDTLWNRHCCWIRQYLEGFVADSNDADDLIQEVSMKIYNSIHSYQAPSSFAGWTKKIAKNTGIDYVRKQKRELHRRNRLRSETDRTENGHETDELPDSRYDPFEALHSKYLRKEVAAALQELSEPQRITMLMRYFEDLSIREIAEAMACPTGTVKSRIHHALRAIRISLDSSAHFMEAK